MQYVTYKFLDRAALKCRSEAWRASIRTGLVPADFVLRFSDEERGRLGMAVLGDDVPLLHQAIDEGLRLAPEHLEAARKLRHAYRLKQTACDPSELLKCKGLFQEAFAANADLRQPLSRIGAAEESYLPFWIL